MNIYVDARIRNRMKSYECIGDAINIILSISSHWCVYLCHLHVTKNITIVKNIVSLSNMATTALLTHNSHGHIIMSNKIKRSMNMYCMGSILCLIVCCAETAVYVAYI